MKAYYLNGAQIDAEAAQWLARLGDPDPAARTPEREMELATWLRRSPDHVRAFLDASDAFYRLDGLTPEAGEQLRRLVDGRGPNVAAFPARGAQKNQEGRRPWRIATIAAGAALAMGAGWMLYQWQGADTYTTAIGEQRTVKLDDGSFVHLNTRSTLEVRFSDTERRVSLVDGEALFTVQQDPHRPFVVRSGGNDLRAVGTAFNVHQRATAVEIAVVEGRVQVSADNPLLLNAGELARVVDGKASRRTEATIADAIAWQQRRLVFRDTPLAEVAAEFNRYNKAQVRIEGRALKEKPLTGVFSADRPQSLVLYLEEFKAITVRRDGDDWVALEQ